MTINRAPEEMYPEIAANEDQREEWVRILAIDEIQKDLAGAVDYTEPLTVEFLKTNPFLTLDTRHFNQEFKDRLIESVADLDGSRQGLLLRAENFHALRLLQRRYSCRICCTYIAPPTTRARMNSPIRAVISILNINRPRVAHATTVLRLCHFSHFRALKSYAHTGDLAVRSYTRLLSRLMTVADGGVTPNPLWFHPSLYPAREAF